MISIKIDKLAKKLGKSITDIANETGLNRNTVTALYHGKAEGIRFDTLEKICQVLDVSVTDVVEFKKNNSPDVKKEETYKQEGELIPFTCWPAGVQASSLNKTYFKNDVRTVHAFWKKDYMEAFWSAPDFNVLAEEVYEKYYEPKKIDELFEAYQQISKLLENYYFVHDEQTFLQLPEKHFLDYFARLQNAYAQFWGISLFIDGFDVGYDQKKIKEISEKYNLELGEVGVLTTPVEMTFNNERLLELLELVATFKRQKKYSSAIDFSLNSQEAIFYRRKYDYYKSNFAVVNHITEEEMAKEINYWLENADEFKKKYKELSNYANDRTKEIKKILSKRRLKENPLHFFQVLTYWREHRKKINLMGVHLLFSVLDYLEEHSGIAKTYLKYISLDEVESVLRGLVTQDVLQRRFEDGMFVTFNENGYKMVLGKEAESLKDQLNKRPEEEKNNIIIGQVASQGYARGKARIVFGTADFSNFHEGEILVTGMTRPEFLPIMKMASAIVTNEGGITCHAAIVSRELGKPCIIGTKNATQRIKDGDLIEVRANHGTVRILN